jgi:hypothetical protein
MPSLGPGGGYGIVVARTTMPFRCFGYDRGSVGDAVL